MNEKKHVTSNEGCHKASCDNYVGSDSRELVYNNDNIYIADERYYRGSYYDPTDARYGYFTRNY